MKITEVQHTKMLQISTSRTKMMINSKPLLVCFLIVIVSLLAARVVPTTGKELTTTQTTPSSYASNHEAQAATVAVASGTGEQTSDKTKSNKQGQTDAQPPAAKVSNNRAEQQAGSSKKCEYDKGQWDECEINGAQQKVMKLKWGGPECKPTKTIRRDCKAKGEVGCKYARGEWSSACQDGLRVRVDTLVGPVGGAQANELARSNHMKCKPQRRVTKDCRRTCHYTKSVWSECSNGFRTRVLTLVNQVDSKSAEGDDSGTHGTYSEASNINVNKQPLAQKLSVPAAAASQTGNQICVRQKLIRRKCTPAESKTTGKSSVQQQQQQQQQRENSQQASSTSSNLAPAQRRRLKQLQLKQQQQQQQPSQGPKHAASSQSPVTTTGAPQPTTTTTTTTTAKKVRTTSSSGSTLTTRGGDGGNSSGSTLATTAPAAGTPAKTTTAAKSGR